MSEEDDDDDDDDANALGGDPPRAARGMLDTSRSVARPVRLPPLALGAGGVGEELLHPLPGADGEVSCPLLVLDAVAAAAEAEAEAAAAAAAVLSQVARARWSTGHVSGGADAAVEVVAGGGGAGRAASVAAILGQIRVCHRWAKAVGYRCIVFG